MHKWLGSPGTPRMDRAGKEAFARAGFSPDQDRYVAVRETLYHLVDGLHGFTATDEVVQAHLHAGEDFHVVLQIVEALSVIQSDSDESTECTQELDIAR